MRKLPFLFLPLLFGYTYGLADDDVEDELIQEFFIGEAVYLQEQGELQITLGTEWFKDDPERWNVSAVVEYGFTDRFQTALSIPYSRLDFEGGSQSGLGDSELELGFGFSDNLDTLAFSMGVGVVLPSGDEDKSLGEGETNLEFFAVFAKRFGMSQVHANFDYEPEETELAYNLNLVHPLFNWRATLEFNGESGEDRDHLFLTPGLTKTGIGAMEVGVGFSLGLNSETPDWAAIIKCTWEFD